MGIFRRDIVENMTPKNNPILEKDVYDKLDAQANNKFIDPETKEVYLCTEGPWKEAYDYVWDKIKMDDLWKQFQKKQREEEAFAEKKALADKTALAMQGYAEEYYYDGGYYYYDGEFAYDLD